MQVCTRRLDVTDRIATFGQSIDPVAAGVLLAKTLVLKAQVRSAAVNEGAMKELQV